jgi:hypothetical protein
MLVKNDMMRFTLDAGTVNVSLRPQGQAHYGLTLSLEIKSREITNLNYYDDLGDPDMPPAPYTATVRYLGDDAVDTLAFDLPDIMTIDTGRTGKIMMSVEAPQINGGVPVLIGRNGNETVNLNFDANGDLRYRNADAAGYTPIGSYAEFQLLNTYGNAPGNKYKQEANLNLLGSNDGGQTWTGQTWDPIREDHQNPFNGLYDGAGYAIRGLRMDTTNHLPDRSYYLGLFAVVNNSTLANIRIESGLIDGGNGGCTVAGLVVYAFGYTTITNCSNNATVTGVSLYTGGVVAVFQGESMTGCYNSGAVTIFTGGGYPVGGVVGQFEGYYMTGCSNSGEVNASDPGWGGGSTGGVAGTFSGNGNITASYNTGVVNGNVSGAVGGLIGSSSGNVTACYNKGAVNGNGAVGGLIGSSFGSVTACYNSGEVNSNSSAGGLIGGIYGDITACYNKGAVTGVSKVGGLFGLGGHSQIIISSYNTGVVTGSSNIGGLAGLIDGDIIIDCYWLYYPGADASTGIGSGSDEGCTKFGDDSGGTPWPFDHGFGWGVGEPGGGRYWKSLGTWNSGGTPTGAASTFPKLWWEED